MRKLLAEVVYSTARLFQVYNQCRIVFIKVYASDSPFSRRQLAEVAQKEELRAFLTEQETMRKASSSLASSRRGRAGRHRHSRFCHTRCRRRRRRCLLRPAVLVLLLNHFDTYVVRSGSLKWMNIRP